MSKLYRYVKVVQVVQVCQRSTGMSNKGTVAQYTFQNLSEHLVEMYRIHIKKIATDSFLENVTYI